MAMVRQDLLRILDLVAVLVAELLAQAQGARRADLHAAVAGDAVVLVHLGGVGALGKVPGVVQEGGPQGVADLDVAVADVEDVVFAVDVGGLVDVAVLLRLLQDLQGFFFSDVVGAAGLHCVVRHVTDLDAPVVDIVCAAFTQFCA